MKVQELIEKLKQFDGKKEVMATGCYCSTGNIDGVNEPGSDYMHYDNIVYIDTDISTG